MSCSRPPVKTAAARAPRAAAPTTLETQAPAARGAEVDFASEYHYVLGDLKRIGILAVAMFATLIALALIIQ